MILHLSNYLLIGIAFLTSTLTAITGVGGGVLLISIMALLLPPHVVVPLHGVVQLGSNASRAAFGWRMFAWQYFWPFLFGVVIGATLGQPLVSLLPTQIFPLILGVFILVVVWLPVGEWVLRIPGRYFSLGIFQTFISLFVGAPGPLSATLLYCEKLSRDQYVATNALLQTSVHVAKFMVFASLGFAFSTYIPLLLGMLIGSILGSWFGTCIRGHVPEELFRNIARVMLSILALRLLTR